MGALAVIQKITERYPDICGYHITELVPAIREKFADSHDEVNPPPRALPPILPSPLPPDFVLFLFQIQSTALAINPIFCEKDGP